MQVQASRRAIAPVLVLVDKELLDMDMVRYGPKELVGREEYCHEASITGPVAGATPVCDKPHQF
jgi:hypothetical protein